MGGRVKYSTEEDRKEAIRAAKRKYNKSLKGKLAMASWYDRNKDDPIFKEKRNNNQQEVRANRTEEELKEYRKRDAARASTSRAKDPIKHMLYDAKKRAKAKGLEFDLVPSDLEVPEFCPVLGIPLFVGGSKRSHNSPSLDRVDNSRGYTKDNVCIISLRANTLKNDATAEELKAIVDYMEGYKWLGTE